LIISLLRYSKEVAAGVSNGELNLLDLDPIAGGHTIEMGGTPFIVQFIAQTARVEGKDVLLESLPSIRLAGPPPRLVT
jgi:hypothetical protein